MVNPIVSRETWLKERMSLLRREKALTRELDLLAIERQKLPWVELTKTYELMTETGEVSLLSLFGDKQQLIVYHFMCGPDWDKPCDGCTDWIDAIDNAIPQIQRHDATLIAVSRAPIEMIKQAKSEKGWSITWASSSRSDFNADFHMSAELDRHSANVGDELVGYDRGESGGINVFVQADGNIYHTYSANNRGIQQMNGALGYLNLLPLNRN